MEENDKKESTLAKVVKTIDKVLDKVGKIAGIILVAVLGLGVILHLSGTIDLVDVFKGNEPKNANSEDKRVGIVHNTQDKNTKSSNNDSDINYQDLYEEVADNMYSELIAKNPNTFMELAMYDIDKDGTLELFLKYGTGEADTIYEVYSTKGNDVVKWGELSGGYTELFKCAEDNGFYTDYCNMGYETVKYVYMEKGELIEKIIFEGNAGEYGDSEGALKVPIEMFPMDGSKEEESSGTMQPEEDAFESYTIAFTSWSEYSEITVTFNYESSSNGTYMIESTEYDDSGNKSSNTVKGKFVENDSAEGVMYQNDEKELPYTVYYNDDHLEIEFEFNGEDIILLESEWAHTHVG